MRNLKPLSGHRTVLVVQPALGSLEILTSGRAWNADFIEECSCLPYWPAWHQICVLSCRAYSAGDRESVRPTNWPDCRQTGPFYRWASQPKRQNFSAYHRPDICPVDRTMNLTPHFLSWRDDRARSFFHFFFFFKAQTIYKPKALSIYFFLLLTTL
jgi:hypothetical protein